MLSSCLTPWLKRLPFLLLGADAGLALWLGATRTLPWPKLPSNQVEPAQFAWLALAALMLALACAAWWSAHLRHVATDGQHLFVDNGRHCETVSLAAVHAVRGRRRIVTVICDGNTPCGRKIRFLAPALARPPQGRPHPTIEVLRRMVRNAQRQIPSTR